MKARNKPPKTPKRYRPGDLRGFWGAFFKEIIKKTERNQKMTETERKLKELERLIQMIKEENPDLNTMEIRQIMIFTGYAAGFPINLIAYAAGITEQTAYNWLRKLPIAYEQAKIKRTEILQLRKRKKITNSPTPA